MLPIRNVVVGISGGVDSAVAALLLKRRGYNVIGVYMKNWDVADEQGVCSGTQDLDDAKFTCDKLKIPFHEVNFVKEYWTDVFMRFTQEYQQGLTPNPDILCNKHIKFKAFFAYARDAFGMDAMATGHYARTSFGEYLDRYETGKRVKLLRPRDRVKDQTFFLSQVPQDSLQRTMFPLGSLTKSEVRAVAVENGLERLARKPESMGICFIGSRKFQSFISEYVTPKPGNFINVDTGQVQGTHSGIHLWTIGQKCGLGGGRDPFYVARKNPGTSDILVAPGLNHPALFSRSFATDEPHWVCDPPDLSYPATLDFKFQHVKSMTRCSLLELGPGRMFAIIERPLRALTPGQYAVFYDGDECLGSAQINSVGPLMYSLGSTLPEDYVEYQSDRL